MNYVFLIGNITKTPEAKTTPNGTSVTILNLAVSRKRETDKTDFFNIVTWRGLADNCARYLVKGQKVAVMGELQTRRYEDKNGIKRYITEINANSVEFLGKPLNNVQNEDKPAQNEPIEYEQYLFGEEMPDSILDEELPF